MQNKKIPTRMCCGCSEHLPKKDLVRIVRTPEGNVELDFTGKKSGRGAYICKNPECLKKAQKTKRLERSLESPVSEEVYARLAKEIENAE